MARPTGDDLAAKNRSSGPIYPLRVPQWSAIAGLTHGFLGRAHSLPPGSFSMRHIRAALASAGETAPLVLAVRQVHGARTVAADALEAETSAGDTETVAHLLPEADAMVSAAAGILLTVRTADCVPILMVAPKAHAVAAVHAGWRGTLGGVVTSTLTALAERYGARPAQVQAALGPAVGGCCYEFDAEHFDLFVAKFGRASERAWRPAPRAERARRCSTDLGYLDLRLMNRLVLETAGVPSASIRSVGPCTAEHPQDLHSFRRDGARAGRQLSYIGWHP